MTTAIGIVITDHIVAGRLEDQRVVGKPVRYPEDPAELSALAAIPTGELLEVIAGRIETLAGKETSGADAIGVAVPGIVRFGIIEDSPNLPQLKGDAHG